MTVQEAIDLLIAKIDTVIDGLFNTQTFLGTKDSNVTGTISYRVRALEEATDLFEVANTSTNAYKDLDMTSYMLNNAVRANGLAMCRYTMGDSFDDRITYDNNISLNHHLFHDTLNSKSCGVLVPMYKHNDELESSIDLQSNIALKYACDNELFKRRTNRIVIWLYSDDHNLVDGTDLQSKVALRNLYLHNIFINSANNSGMLIPGINI